VDAETATWTILAGLNRWALYALMLISAGSALFLLITPAPELVARATRRFAKFTALLAALAYLAAVGFGGAEIMTGGPAALIAPDTWIMGARTSLGLSAAVGAPGMLILWAGFAWNRRVLLTTGFLAGILSFLLTGHAAIAEPTWLASPSVAIHLIGAAYWIGALFPLSRAARALEPAAAGTLIAAFSRRALWLVSAIVITGLAISRIQLAAPAALVTTPYGVRLIIKVALFGALLALAAYNKLVLTPQITSGARQAAPRLHKIIQVEYILLVLVLGAAASLTLTEPPRAFIHNTSGMPGALHP